MRPSGVELTRAFADGVTSAGADVVDLGLTSTDELYFASGSLDAPGAMFTASHNPAHYNGIKLCLSGARPVGADTGLREIMAVGRRPSAGTATRRRPSREASSQADVLGAYAAKVRSFVRLATPCGPSRWSPTPPTAWAAWSSRRSSTDLPFQLEILFGELDGTFPNHPADPIQPENLVALQSRILDDRRRRGPGVRRRRRPLLPGRRPGRTGVGFDDHRPGGRGHARASTRARPSCTTSSAPRPCPEIIRERGGIPVRTRVGHSYIKAIMADTDALFGGEHSGHYYFRDNYRADSGSIAALVVLEVLSQGGPPAVASCARTSSATPIRARSTPRWPTRPR